MSIVKVLCIGDPHIQLDNILEFNKFLENITILAKEKKPDLIVILGDTLHTHERLHTIPLNKAYEFVNIMSSIAKTYILVGNHDYISNTQYLSENHWLNGMKVWDNVVVVDRVKSLIINNKKFIFVPYVSNGMFEKALNTFNEYDWKEVTCIFAHQEFYGCKMGGIISIEGDKWDNEYPLVISGHIHSRQKIGNNIYYPGSAMQNAFGESDKNIIPFIIFKENNEYECEEINLELPRKKIIYMDVTDIDDYKLPKSEDKIKVTLSGNYDEFKALKKTSKYKKMIDEGVKVVFKPKKIKKENVEEEKVVWAMGFKNILNCIINKEKNTDLLKAYEVVVNGNEINKDDIFFL